MSERMLWIGTYTDGSEPGGRGAGVHAARLDLDTGELSGGGAAVDAVGPSFLALHPDGGRMYGVSERSEGGLACFPTTVGGVSAPMWEVRTGGGSPCHVMVHPEGRHVIAANYADGSVTVHDATTGDVVARSRHSGSGPVSGRQDGAHAHSTVFSPGGTHLLIADLGTDELRCHAFDPDAADPLGPASVAARLEPGTGPRHMAVGTTGHIYVAGELDARVHVLEWDAATAGAKPVASVPATGTDGPAAYPGEVALSRDGGRLYVSNRGPDTIAAFAVETGGARLRHLADTPADCAWPRHFTLIGDHLVAAGQNSGTVTSLRIDPATGVPSHPHSAITVPDPACVVPAMD